MDVRTPFFQNIACVLIGVLFLNPIVATAAELALDAQAGGNAAVTQAANGVPMVNIATPNGSGLSHNKFTDFNVDQQGLILNNSAQALVQTQLGGYVLGNPNLKGGAANLILNEVNGGTPSQLKGYTEVAGKSAHVIVANPHGISCDGCGFINTPRVTLSTGKPVVVEGGLLERFEVDGGQISIEGDGLNAHNVSQFDLITRSAQINAELHANRLNVIAGRNEVDAATLKATAKADNGSAKPQLAIDSSSLGGMYAGAIRLVGSEAGVGVKLAGDMAASAGDIQIDANGQLSLARTAASRDLQLKAQGIELNGDTFAGRDAKVEASGQTQVKQSLAATNQLTLRGGELLNQGVVEAGVRADGSLNGSAHLTLATDKVSNPGMITSHGSLNADVQTLDNRNGKLLSAGDATLTSQTLDNRAGRIVAQQSLDVKGTQLNNQGGETLAQQGIKVTAASLANQNGTLAGGALDLQLSAALDNQGGLIESASDMQLTANTLSNSGGKLRALGGESQSSFTLGGLFNNDAGLVEIGSGVFALSSVGLSNLGGTVSHVGDQGFAIDLTALGQAGGRFITNSAVDLSLDEWSNISSLQAKTLNIDINRLTQSASGALIAIDGITTRGEHWENHGRIETDGALNLTLTGAYSGNGKLLAQGDLSLTADSVEPGSDAELHSAGSAQFDISTGLSNAGKITSAKDLSLKAASLSNLGTLGTAKALRIESNSLRNEQGLIFSGSDMSLLSETLHNVSGDIYSAGRLDIARNSQGQASSLFSNLSGTIESVGDLRLSADSITNARTTLDVLSHKAAARMTYAGCYDCSGKRNANYVLEEIDRTEVTEASARASLLSGGSMLLHGRDVLNSSSLIAASGDLSITVQNFSNKGAALGEYLTQRFLNSHRINNIYALFDDVDAFNARNWPQGGGNISAEINNFLQAYIYDHYLLGAPVFTPGATAEYAGVLQAGQTVTINATNTFAQSEVRPSFDFVSGGSRLGDTSTGSTIATTVTLNPQLPPDLAQQAVDPLALPGFSLPQGQNGLFQINTQVGHPYLIETNPVFASLKNFLNSDYMLGSLGYDPQTAQKRLGDGLYEQRLIREAVVARTGQRYLAGLTSDEAMFRYLMDNAIASKEALNLSLGVSLTAEQVAALTHDLVWMEERVVAGENVLVPVLYLAQAEGRLAPNGALIQGRNLALISGGDLRNQGTLRASNNLSVTASNISNSGLMQAGERLSLLATDSIRNAQGGIIAGKDVTAIALTGDIVNERTVTRHESVARAYQHQQDFADSGARIEAANNLSLGAGRDIANLGGVLDARSDLDISAGRDVTITSVQERTKQARDSSYLNEQVNQRGAEINAGRDIQIDAGRDLSAVASRIEARRNIALDAVGDVTLGAAANEEHFYSKSKKLTRQEDHVKQQSTEVNAGGDVFIGAGQDLTLLASKVEASQEAYLVAGNNLALLSAEDQDYSYYLKTKTSKSGLSSTKKTLMDSSRSTTQVGSLVSADKVIIQADQDIGVSASDVVSTNGTLLQAGRNVLIDGAVETSESSHAESKKKSGVMSSGGIGFTIGSASTKSTQSNYTEQLRGSTIGSVLGNVEIQASKDLTIRGSDVVAGQDIQLSGQNVNILAAQNNNRSEQTYKSKTGGLTLALSGTVGSAVDSTYQTVKQARGEDDSRLSALQGIKAGLTGVQAWQAAQQGGGMSAENAGQFIGISASLGSQKSSSKQVQEQSVSQGSSLSAGNNLNIRATGNGAAGQDGDIRIQGSQLKAGNDLLLAANRDIVLEAAANTQKLDGKNKSSDGAIGVSLGVGPQGGGLSVFANANQATGKEKGNGTTWTESTLDAGSQVKLVSGRDTVLRGAQVNGEQVVASVGRDLTLQSLQDNDDYNSRQKSVSAGASVAIIGVGSGANLSASQSKIDSKYSSVQEQTGFYAGKGGFQIDVGKHTQLEGSVIASTAEADKNHLSTSTLGWSDIRNKADYQSQQQSVSVSGANSGSGGFTGNMPSGVLVAYTHGDSARGTTASAISGGNIEIRDPAKQQQDVTTLSRDTEHANGSISPIFDKEKEQQRLQQVQLIAEIGNQSMDILRTQGELNADEAARKELAKQGNSNPSAEQVRDSATYKKVMSEYGTGSDLQRAAQAVRAALQGLAGGDIGSALAGASAPYLAQLIKQQLGDNDTARIMAHAVLGAVVAQAQGNSAAAGAAGAASGEAMAMLISKALYAGVASDQLSEEQKQTVSALATLAAGLAGAAAAGDAAGALAGAQGGKNAVENNVLGPQSQAQRDKAREMQLQNQYTEASAKQLVMGERADQLSDQLLKKYALAPETMSKDEYQALMGYLQIYVNEQIRVHGEEQATVALMQLLYSTQPASYDYEYALSTQARGAYDADWFREQGQNEELYRDALNVIKVGNEQEGMAKVGNEAIYLLGGGLGNTIRFLAAANGAVQTGVGIGQATEGDYWNAAGNILFGVLGMATVAVPGAKVPVLKAPPVGTGMVVGGAKEVAGAATTGGTKIVPNKADRPTIGTLIDDQVRLVETDKLRPGTIETFRSGQYVTVETTESVSLFRKFGGGPNQAKLDGGFASTIQNAGRQEAAVYPSWSNSRFEAELAIPEGQKLNIGSVGQQPPSSLTPKYRGGADQVLLPRNWSTDWVKSVRDGKTGVVYTYDEFKAAFPDQVTRGN